MIEKLSPTSAWCISSSVGCGIDWHMDKYPSHIHGLVGIKIVGFVDCWESKAVGLLSADEANKVSRLDVWKKLMQCPSFGWTVQHPNTSIFIPAHVRHCTFALEPCQSLINEHITALHIPWMSTSIAYTHTYYLPDSGKHSESTLSSNELKSFAKYVFDESLCSNWLDCNSELLHQAVKSVNSKLTTLKLTQIPSSVSKYFNLFNSVSAQKIEVSVIPEYNNNQAEHRSKSHKRTRSLSPVSNTRHSRPPYTTTVSLSELTQAAAEKLTVMQRQSRKQQHNPKERQQILLQHKDQQQVLKKQQQKQLGSSGLTTTELSTTSLNINKATPKLRAERETVEPHQNGIIKSALVNVQQPRSRRTRSSPAHVSKKHTVEDLEAFLIRLRRRNTEPVLNTTQHTTELIVNSLSADWHSATDNQLIQQARMLAEQYGILSQHLWNTETALANLVYILHERHKGTFWKQQAKWLSFVGAAQKINSYIWLGHLLNTFHSFRNQLDTSNLERGDVSFLRGHANEITEYLVLQSALPAHRRSSAVQQWLHDGNIQLNSVQKHLNRIIVKELYQFMKSEVHQLTIASGLGCTASVYGELVLSSASKLIDWLRSNSTVIHQPELHHFVDAGSALCSVACHIAVELDQLKVTAIELNEAQVEAARLRTSWLKQKYQEIPLLLSNFDTLHGDFVRQHSEVLMQGTILYLFDKCYPAETMQLVANLLNSNLSNWQYLISSRKLKYWENELGCKTLQLIGAPLQVETTSQQHTLYLYQHKVIDIQDDDTTVRVASQSSITQINE